MTIWVQRIPVINFQAVFPPRVSPLVYLLCWICHYGSNSEWQTVVNFDRVCVCGLSRLTPGCAVSSRAGQARLDCNAGRSVSWSRHRGVLVEIQNNLTSKSSSDRKYQNIFRTLLLSIRWFPASLEKVWKVARSLEHFLLSWGAALTNQEGINERALI